MTSSSKITNVDQLEAACDAYLTPTVDRQVDQKVIRMVAEEQHDHRVQTSYGELLLDRRGVAPASLEDLDHLVLARVSHPKANTAMEASISLCHPDPIVVLPSIELHDPALKPFLFTLVPDSVLVGILELPDDDLARVTVGLDNRRYPGHGWQGTSEHKHYRYHC